MLFRKQLSEALEQALSVARERGLIPGVNSPEITIERPARPEHGDYACSLPLKLARVAGLKPMDVAHTLVKNLPPMLNVEKVTVAPPGFINFSVSRVWLMGQVNEI